MTQEHKEYQDALEAYAGTLIDVSANGQKCTAGDTMSIGHQQTSLELLNYTFTLRNPRERLPWNANVTFDIELAVARFVWIMAGNDRLSDIEFYASSSMQRLSDDEVTLPGSSYGKRMRDSRPGLDQIVGAINRLKVADTRRAAISIFQPDDATRKSKDIPCAFGLIFNIRQGILNTTILMRSNNALKLLPFNLFEFSLLAEAIAVACNVELGPVFYHAVSMHIFEDAVGNGIDFKSFQGNRPDRVAFPKMPPGDVMSQIKELVKLETQARSTGNQLTEEKLDRLIDQGETTLNSYWRELFFVLLLRISKKSQLAAGIMKLSNKMTGPWRAYCNYHIDSATNVVSRSSEVATPAIPKVTTISTFDLVSEKRTTSLESRIVEHNSKPDADIVSFEEYTILRKKLVTPRGELALAARDVSESISPEEFARALHDIRPG